MKGRAAQRKLDRRVATLSKLKREAAEAQWDQNSEKLEEISSLMNEESREHQAQQGGQGQSHFSRQQRGEAEGAAPELEVQ